jgi:hypothetical protein
MCGQRDAVRSLHAVYYDRRRRRREQLPLINRYGILLRGAALLMAMPGNPGGLRPPHRPSRLAAYFGFGPLELTAGLVGLGLVAVMLAHSGALELPAALALGLALGTLGSARYERGDQVWATRSDEWERAMQAWRDLRYCVRCNQVVGQ